MDALTCSEGGDKLALGGQVPRVPVPRGGSQGAPSERQETPDSVGGLGGSCNFMLMMRRMSGLPQIDHEKGMIDTGFTTYSVS